MKYIRQFWLICGIIGMATMTLAQEAPKLPSKLQLAVEPEEITLTKGMTVDSPDKHIHLIARETSGLNPANLEFVAHPFTDVATGDIVDADIITIELSEPQASLSPGGLQRVEVTIGGFRQAGSYLGAITIHDTVSGEQREVSVRVSVKDSWLVPTLILLAAVLMASGINYWTRKGKRKNSLDQTIAELSKTIKLAGGHVADPYLRDAAEFLEQARQHNQEYRFPRAETTIAEAEQKLAQYEQRKQGSEALHQHIQSLLQEVRELGENDPQQARISDELIRLLPTLQSDYEQHAALVKQIELFFRAYRLARQDFRSAREKLSSANEYVQKADKSRIELYFRDIEHRLASAENLHALDEVNALLRKVAYELSPEKINENIFREQKMQKRLWEYEQRLKLVSGTQMKRIVTTWHETAQTALEDNRYDDAENALHHLEETLNLVEQIKQAEQHIKGRDPRMTELRRILRNSKNRLEQETSGDVLEQVAWDVEQVQAMLADSRKSYEPFQSSELADTETRSLENGQSTTMPPETETEHLRPLTREDVQQQIEQTLEEASKYPKLRLRIGRWSEYCQKLLKFEELNELSDYVRLIQDEITLYARLQALRTRAGDVQKPGVLKLIEQAEQVLETEPQDEVGSYHRAEVLADAAAALLEEPTESREFEQVFSYIRSPKTTSNVIAYGTLGSYFIVTTLLGLQILYAPDPDFGALMFKDYFSLILWALGLEGAKLTVMNVYETYIKKNG